MSLSFIFTISVMRADNSWFLILCLSKRSVGQGRTHLKWHKIDTNGSFLMSKDFTLITVCQIKSSKSVLG